MGMMLLIFAVPFVSLLIIAYALLGWKVATACLTIGTAASLVQFNLFEATFFGQFISAASIPLYISATIFVAIACKVIYALAHKL